MTANGIRGHIQVSGKELETSKDFKCLGAMLLEEGSKQDVLSRIVQASTALERLNSKVNKHCITLQLIFEHAMIFRYASET